MPINPNATPNAAPNPICAKSMSAMSAPPICEAPSTPYFAARSAVNTTVSIYEAGSLEPDSISKREEVRYLRLSLRERRILKTEAASVEEMTEPINMLSIQPIPPSKKGSRRKIKYTPTPTNPAVSAVPASDKRSACGATGRASLKLVPNPP